MKYIIFLLVLLTITFQRSKYLKHSDNQNLDHYPNISKSHKSDIGPYSPYNNQYGNNYPNGYSGQEYYPSNSQSKKDDYFAEFFFGGFLYFLSAVMLWFNEKRHVKSSKRIHRAKKLCENLNPLEINPNTEGKLVHASGETYTNEYIFDNMYGVNVSNSVKLIRVCEMYQWQETRRTKTHRDSNGNSRTSTYYTYDKGWYPYFIDSSRFHKNGGNGYGNNDQDFNYPPGYQQQNMGFGMYQKEYFNDSRYFLSKGESWTANSVSFGAFFLSKSQKEKCKNQVDVQLTQDILQNAYSINRTHGGVDISGNTLTFKIQQNTGTTLGDFRVSFYRVPCGPTSVVAKQTGNTFNKWSFATDTKMYMDEISSSEEEDVIPSDEEEEVQPQGCCSCICICCDKFNTPISSINWVEEKQLSLKKMFKQQKKSEKLRTSLTRWGGWLGTIIGIGLIFSPIYKLFYWFPLIGGFLGAVGKFFAFLIGAVLGSITSMLVIGISWIRYRPKVAYTLLGIAIALIAYILILKSQH